MKQKPNSLINEKSPYLLQHAYNPVDWHPWTDETFNKAKELDKPVFLSIGYSTCHWCHVMEHESFEDESVANMMNDAFVSVKVDREERPDIDNIYMTVCQMLTGSGGWPLTIVMTPDKKPFFAGTYLPKQSRGQRIGMYDLISRVDELWKSKRDDILNSAKQITERIQSLTNSGDEKDISHNVFDESYSHFNQLFDEEFGGFGQSPKFPSPHNLMFLLRYSNKFNNAHSLHMVEKTLSQMRLGGIFDHIGYGFHRYSTDKEWLLPHFEKMLYDQAMISLASIETYQLTQNEKYKRIAEEVFEYVLRDMVSEDGGFYSAEDADSEGEEGKFYVWSEDELLNILGKDKAELIYSVFNTDEAGNFVEEASRTRTGMNILFQKEELEVLADKAGMDVDTLASELEEIRSILFNVREKRIHPGKDDKVLTDWNGLMISALARGGAVFNEAKYTYAASSAVEFISKNLTEKNGKLLHRYRDSESAFTANLDDYAFLIMGLIDLFESTGKFSSLEKAIDLTEITIESFSDKENGGFYFTPDYGEKLLVRTKESYDSAIPSGNSVMAQNLIKLSRITANPKYEEVAMQSFKTFAENINRAPWGFSFMLCTYNYLHSDSYEIIVSGTDTEVNEAVKKLNKHFLPNKVVIPLLSAEEKLLERLKHLKEYSRRNNGLEIFVCKNNACELPVNSVDKALNLIKHNQD